MADAIFARLAEDVFHVLGEAATFRPRVGAAVACTVRVSAPDVLAGLSEARAVSADIEVRALSTEIPRPRQGDRFEMADGRVLHALETARDPDGAGKVWAVAVEAR